MRLPCGTRPPHDQPPLVEQQTEFPADNPAVVREAFAAKLLGAAPFRIGWINSVPYVWMTPSTVGAAKNARVQS